MRHRRQAGARPPRGYAGGCSRGRRSTTTRCRRSARARRRARCGSRACARPAAAAAPSSSAHRAARRGRARRVPAGLALACAMRFHSIGRAIIGVMACSHCDRLRGRKSSASSSAPACAACWSRPTVWTASGSMRNGRRLLSFCCNDYLNLTHHPAVKEAAIEALERYGVGAAPRGSSPAIIRCSRSSKRRLARLKGTEAACVFGSGYLANTGIIPALIGARRSRPDRRTGACLPVGGRAAVARDGRAVPPLRRRRMSKPCWPSIAAASPARADRDRRRVLHGRRPRAAAGAGGAWRSATTPG